MKLVRPGLNHRIHDRAIASSKLSAIGVGLDFEFGDRIHRRLDHVRGFIEQVTEVRVVVHSVEQEIVLQRAGSIGTETERLFRARSRLGGYYTCTQLR